MISFAAQESKIRLKIKTASGAQYVSLYDLCEQGNLDQSIDPVIQRGKIYFGKHSAVYQIGLKAALVDGKIVKSDSEIQRGNGYEVFIPADIAKQIVEDFFGGDAVFDNGFLISRDRPEIKKTETRAVKTEHREKIDFIVIDAGHGGKDPGAVGKGGSMEKQYALALSKKLAVYLKKKLAGVNIKLTRSKDFFLELGERTEIANKMLKKKNNGIFICIHLNASISPKVSGYETYYLSRNPTSDDARVTAALENNVIMMESGKKHKYDDVEFVEALMMTTQIQRESSRLAEMIQKSMEGEMRISESRGVKRADFFVLRGSLMPAILTEVGYITNPEELSHIKTEKYQNKIVKAIGEGIFDFVSNYDNIVNGH